MKAFITGIGGFAGSHLAELLLREKEEVFGLVRDKKKCFNLEGPAGIDPALTKGLTLCEGDILHEELLRGIIGEIRPDVIYHVAGIASVPYATDNPDLAFEVNFTGARRLLDAVLKSGQAPRILLVGSADVYGDVSPENLPIREDCPFRPLSPYAVGKAATDLLAFQYFKTYGLPILRARPFNHIGPRQAMGFVCSDFAGQIAEIEAGKRDPVVYTGDLRPEKDFLDVRDVVRAYHLIAKHASPGEVFNICRGEAVAIGTLLDKLIAMSGREIEIRQEEKRLRKAEARAFIGNAQALKSRTGWAPTISLDESLERILDYQRTRVMA